MVAQEFNPVLLTYQIVILIRIEKTLQKGIHLP
jgi:hypothetical protein